MAPGGYSALCDAHGEHNIPRLKGQVGLCPPQNLERVGCTLNVLFPSVDLTRAHTVLLLLPAPSALPVTLPHHQMGAHSV